MIKVTAGRVYLTETTLKELLAAVEQVREEAKEKGGFVQTPMPEGDYSNDALIAAQKERGHILVESTFSGDSFMIDLEEDGAEKQGSLGYRLT